MNAVIAICNFCELHGPSVLFCTQSFHDSEETQWTQVGDQDTKSNVTLKSWYGPSFFKQRSSSPEPVPEPLSPLKSDHCEVCITTFILNNSPLSLSCMHVLMLFKICFFSSVLDYLVQKKFQKHVVSHFLFILASVFFTCVWRTY